MTPKLAGRLDYNAQTLAALAKWMQNGEKKPRRTFAKKKVRARSLGWAEAPLGNGTNDGRMTKWPQEVKQSPQKQNLVRRSLFYSPLPSTT